MRPFRFKTIPASKRSLSTFNQLHQSTYNAVLQVCQWVEVPKQEVLFWSGDKNLFIGEIIDGVVLLKVSDSSGCDHVVAALQSGDMITTPWRHDCIFGAEVAVDSEIALIARADLERISVSDPMIEKCMGVGLENSLNKIATHQALVMPPSAMRRVSGFLLSLPESRSHIVELPYSRAEIAEILNLTIETVSRQLTELKNRQILDFSYGSKAFLIIDREALLKLAQ